MDETPVSVRAVRDVGPGTIAVEFRTPEEFVAEPGQFVRVVGEFDGDEEGRFYTLSSPTVVDTFEITVSVDPDGTFGPWLAAREPGDEVRISGPFGGDYYEGEDEVLLLASGPGVGPAVAIAERALDEAKDVALVYRDDAPVHEDRLDELAASGAHVTIANGDIQEPIESTAGDTDSAPFVYGFAEFCEDAVAALEELDYDAGEAKVESFGPAP